MKERTRLTENGHVDLLSRGEERDCDWQSHCVDHSKVR